MLSDEELECTRRIAQGTGSKHTIDLLDEIARLRAEVDQLRAARLRPETVRELMIALITREDGMRKIRHLVGDDAIENVAVALADLYRAYPEEE